MVLCRPMRRFHARFWNVRPRAARFHICAPLRAQTGGRVLQMIRICSFTALIAIFGLAVSFAQPPSADTAEAALADSPRHGEYVEIPLPESDTKLYTWVVYPERPDKAPIILVIHEIFGMTDWVNSVADAFAKEGFIALAPDMISGKDKTQPPTATVRALTDDEIVSRLNAVRDYGLSLPAASGTSASIGFCWGGSSSFTYAVAQPELDAAVVCYGTSPAKEDVAKIKAPVLGLYAENDARVNTTIPNVAEGMTGENQTFEHEIYEGAGHGFFRAQDGQDGANGKAAEAGWERALTFLREHTETAE
jgi:carboxymethylenebutenolidase